MRYRILLMLLAFAKVIGAQSFNGGVNDGFSEGSLQLLTVPSIYTGGAADGFSRGSNVPTAIAIYKGGGNDGFAPGRLISPETIAFYHGGNNDGFATAVKRIAPSIAIYSGGYNDGFASNNIYVSVSFSRFAGSSNDGFALGSISNLSWINYYRGGINDGFSSALIIPPVVFTAYRGGMNDGFAVSTATAEVPPPPVCQAPSNLGVMYVSGTLLAAKWNSVHYPNNNNWFQIASGINISTPQQGTIISSSYYLSQSPQFASYGFSNGNTPGFTFFVRDICGAGDTSNWVGPFIYNGSSKRDSVTSTDTAVGITEDLKQGLESLRIYPNPVTGHLVFVDGSSLDESSTVIISDMNGSTVLVSTYLAEGHDVSQLASGVYLISLVTKRNTYHLRLVIKH
ncbi:MAG: T9SS type A sorting domain-containing protein [Chitinophagales bacterium]